MTFLFKILLCVLHLAQRIKSLSGFKPVDRKTQVTRRTL